MVVSEAVEERGIQVVDMDRIADDVVSVVVGLAVNDSGPDPPAGHPNRVTTAVVVAAVIVLHSPLAVDGPSELPPPDDERVVEHAPGLEVGQKRRLRLVDVAGLLGDVRWQRAMLVPAAVIELHTANPPFEQPAGEETVGRKRPRPPG